MELPRACICFRAAKNLSDRSSPSTLVSLRYVLLGSIRDSQKTRSGCGGVPISEREGGRRGWLIHRGVFVGFAWVSGRQELSVSQHTLDALRRRMYCRNKPSSCSVFLLPAPASAPRRALPRDTPHPRAASFERERGEISLVDIKPPSQWTTDSDRI